MDEQFIIDLYQRLALRSPTQAEIDAGLTAIEERGQDAYAQEIGETEEVVEIQTVVLPIIGLYQAFLERTPEPAGLEFWTTAIQSGALNFGDLIQSFVTTNEFAEVNPGIGANPTNEDLVNLFYTNILGRVPDADGQAFWLSALQNGTIQAGSFTTTFIGSSEVQSDIGAALRAYYADVKDGQIDDPANSNSLRDADDGDGGDVTDPSTGGVDVGNIGPVANDDSFDYSEGTQYQGSVAANDSDANGDNLTYTLTEAVAGLTFNPDGSFAFDANDPAYADLSTVESRTVSADYSVSDGSATATATLTINIQGTEANQKAFVDGSDGSASRSQAEANESDSDIYWATDRTGVDLAAVDGKLVFTLNEAQREGKPAGSFYDYMGVKLVSSEAETSSAFTDGDADGFNIGSGGGIAADFFINPNWSDDEGMLQRSGIWAQLQNDAGDLDGGGRYSIAEYVDPDAAAALVEAEQAPEGFEGGFRFWSSADGWYDYQNFDQTGDVSLKLLYQDGVLTWTVSMDDEVLLTSSFDGNSTTMADADRIETVIINSRWNDDEEEYVYDNIHLFDPMANIVIEERGEEGLSDLPPVTQDDMAIA